MAISASVICRHGRFSLQKTHESLEPTVVPAEVLTIEIEGEIVPHTVAIDGKVLPLVGTAAGTRGLLTFDAFRSVGYHHLRVNQTEFLFATADAKLKLDGVLRMLQFLKHEALAWRGPLFFSDGTAIRHPKIDYAWIAHIANRILTTADAIAECPFRKSNEHRSIQPPHKGRIVLSETLALLRRNPRTLLEPSATGVISVGDGRYFPRTVVSASSASSAFTTGNRRVARVLRSSLDLCRSLFSQPDLPRADRRLLHELITNLQARTLLFPFVSFELDHGRLNPNPAPEEIADDRYVESYALYEELMQEVAWEPGLHVADRFAYVGLADQIYQAFVAMVVAHAFEAKHDLSCIQSNLTAPLFRSAVFDIYYDTSPPRPEFVSWRDLSDRPSDQKPDLTIIDRIARRGIFLDAKYRIEASGRSPTSAVEEVQVYLQSFERRSIAVCYPGDVPAIYRISGKDYTVLELAIAPNEDILDFARTAIRPAIESLMEPLGTAE